MSASPLPRHGPDSPGRLGPAGTVELLRECLTAVDRIRLIVTGDCMTPAMEAGEIAVLRSPSKQAPRLGDVVLVRQPAGLRLHRLVLRVPGLGCWTRADRAFHFD